MPFNCNFYCDYFDIYHSGLARPALFFVTVYIVKISTVCNKNQTKGSSKTLLCLVRFLLHQTLHASFKPINFEVSLLSKIEGGSGNHN